MLIAFSKISPELNVLIPSSNNRPPTDVFKDKFIFNLFIFYFFSICYVSAFIKNT